MIKSLPQEYRESENFALKSQVFYRKQQSFKNMLRLSGSNTMVAGLLLSGLFPVEGPSADALLDLKLLTDLNRKSAGSGCKLLLHATQFSPSAAETCKQEDSQVCNSNYFLNVKVLRLQACPSVASES